MEKIILIIWMPSPKQVFYLISVITTYFNLNGMACQRGRSGPSWKYASVGFDGVWGQFSIKNVESWGNGGMSCLKWESEIKIED